MIGYPASAPPHSQRVKKDFPWIFLCFTYSSFSSHIFSPQFQPLCIQFSFENPLLPPGPGPVQCNLPSLGSLHSRFFFYSALISPPLICTISAILHFIHPSFFFFFFLISKAYYYIIKSSKEYVQSKQLLFSSFNRRFYLCSHSSSSLLHFWHCIPPTSRKRPGIVERYRTRFKAPQALPFCYIYPINLEGCLSNRLFSRCEYPVQSSACLHQLRLFFRVYHFRRTFLRISHSVPKVVSIRVFSSTAAKT